MGRPPMAVGTYGTIRFTKLPGGYRAKARFRGYDGVIRDIGRTGASKAKAERELKLAITQELQTPSGGEISAKTRFRDVAEKWLAWQERRVAMGERATGTLDNYRSMLRNHVLPALGELRLSEVTVPRLDRFFPAVQAKASAAHARTARAVVSGVLRYAVRHGALTTNPVREIEPIEGSGRRKARALSPDERRECVACHGEGTTVCHELGTVSGHGRGPCVDGGPVGGNGQLRVSSSRSASAVMVGFCRCR
jgi:hypothetical protein